MIYDLEDCIFPIDKPEVKQLRDASWKLVDEVLRYGIYITGLVITENKNRGVTEKVLIFLLKESLETLEGIGVLLKDSCVEAASPLIRKLFECYIQIKYLMNDFTEQKAIAYEIFHIHKQIAVLDYLVKLEKRDKSICLEKIESLKKMLLQPGFHEINEKRSKLVAKKGKYPQWYTLIDTKCTGINALIKATEPEQVTLDIYSYLSKSSHGFCALDECLLMDDSQIVMGIMRKPYNLARNANYSVGLLFSIYGLVMNLLSLQDVENLHIWFNTSIETKRSELLYLQEKVDLFISGHQ